MYEICKELLPNAENTCHCTELVRSWMGVANHPGYADNASRDAKLNRLIGSRWVGKAFCEICGLWASKATAETAGQCSYECAGWELRQLHPEAFARLDESFPHER